MFTVVGKNHLQGISKKSGQPYNLNILYCVTDGSPRDISLEGQKVTELVVHPTVFNNIMVGESFSDFLRGSDDSIVQLV